MSMNMDAIQQLVMDQGARQFLAKLDACQGERERLDCVAELVFGIVMATQRKIEKERQEILQRNGEPS